LNAGVGPRPIREQHVRIEHLKAPPKARKRRLEFPLPPQRRPERHVSPDETGRIVKPFGHTQRFLGKMERLLHLEQVQIMEHQAAKRREPPGIIPKLLTELRCVRIGSANVGVAEAPGREQRWTKRHLQIQLPFGPLAHIR
jgi:hypothetical protein